jgi:hypothetical protein
MFMNMVMNFARTIKKGRFNRLCDYYHLLQGDNYKLITEMLKAKKSIVEPAAFFALPFRVNLKVTGFSKLPVCIYQSKKFHIPDGHYLN